MDWFFYTPMRFWHELMAWVSLAIFLVRGLLHQLEQPWAERMAIDGRVLVIAFGTNTLLIVSGLCLLGGANHSLSREPWLLVKLICLIGYFAFGHWGMGQGRFHLLGYLLALLMMSTMMAASYLRF